MKNKLKDPILGAALRCAITDNVKSLDNLARHLEVLSEVEEGLGSGRESRPLEEVLQARFSGRVLRGMLRAVTKFRKVNG